MSRVYRVCIPCVHVHEVLVLADNPQQARLQAQRKDMTEVSVKFDHIISHGQATWNVTDEYPEANNDDLIVYNLDELAQHVCGSLPENPSLADLEKCIARRVYKDTYCGAIFAARGLDCADRVDLAGYVEGVDGDPCPTHTLWFPFPISAWYRVLEECDKDAQEVWNDTHGCSSCFDGQNPDHHGPIDPNCPACKGEGVVI